MHLRAIGLVVLLPLLLGQTKPASSTAPTTATSPATTTKPKSFTTMLDILGATPAELRPQPRDDWYKFTEPKFGAWWKEQLIGLAIEQTIIIGKPDLFQEPVRRANGPVWMIQFATEVKSFNFWGQEHKWQIAVGALNVDEASAKAWNAVAKNTPIKVKGIIRDVHLTDENQDHSKMPAYRVILDIKDVECTLPK